MNRRMAFRDNWLEAVNIKNSVLCAGIDPAEFGMKRGEQGLLRFVNKRGWSFAYVEAIASYCAAIKTNVNYWKNNHDMKTLAEIVGFASSLNLVVIDDSKLADMGSSNDAGLYYAAKKGMDAITVAPFAGNIEEIVKQSKPRGVGIISMCLMSNPEYEREKNKLISVDKNKYNVKDIIHVDKEPHVRQYIQLANDANHYGVDGIVIGAPSEKNHIEKEEIYNVKKYVGENMLVLMPGGGTQKGEVNVIWKYFDRNNVIVNVGRDLMFPNGSASTFEEHKNMAKYWKEKLNELRNGKI